VKVRSRTLVTVSSGPMLGCDIIDTPPPSVGRCQSAPRPYRREVDLVLDLYARSPQLQCWTMCSFCPERGLRSSVGQSSFHSVSSAQSETLVTMSPMAEAMGTSAILTEESSGSGMVVPPTGRGEDTYPHMTSAETLTFNYVQEPRGPGLTRSRFACSKDKEGWCKFC
jgi:hypothetical protein